jgi:ketosteroid isomerase-like protein
MPTKKQIIQCAYQAFAQGDLPHVLAATDDQIGWTEAEGFPLHGTHVGPQAVVDGVFMRTGEIGDDFTVAPTRFVAEDDTVVAIGTYSCNHLTPALAPEGSRRGSNR